MWLLTQVRPQLGGTLAAVLLISLIMTGKAAAQMPGYLSKDANPSKVENASMVQLIANPERYDGKQVQLIGFLRIEFEGNALYLHREDYERGITRDGLWIDLPSAMSKQQAKAVNMQYVICLGTFEAAHHGHMDLFSGEIKDVLRLQVWPSTAVVDQTSSGAAKKQR